MLVKLAFAMQRFKKYLKIFSHDKQRWGGGGGNNFWILWDGTIFGFYGGDIELMGVPPLGKTLHISCMVMSSEVTNTLSVPTVYGRSRRYLNPPTGSS